MKQRNETAEYKREWKNGIKEGKLKEKLNMAKKMKEKGMQLEDIKEITGLTIEDIKKL